MKDAELINNRIATLQNLDAYVGKYYSVEWVRRNILMQSDDDIKDIDKQIEQEKEIYGSEEQPQEPQGA